MKKIYLIVYLTIFIHSLCSAQWVKTSFPQGTQSIFTFSLAYGSSLGNYLFVAPGSAPGFYRTSDNGNTWTKLDSTLPPNVQVMAIVQDGDWVIAAVADPQLQGNAGIYRSSNLGKSWERINLAHSSVLNFLILGDSIYGCEGSEIILSSDHGLDWINYSNAINGGQGIIKLLPTANYLYAATFHGGGVTRSSNNGKTWKTFNNDLSLGGLKSIVNQGVTLFASDGWVFRSKDSAEHWESVLQNTDIQTLTTSENLVFAGGKNIFSSTDSGNTWNDITENIHSNTNLLIVKDDFLFALTDIGIYRRPISDFNVVSQNTSLFSNQVDISNSPDNGEFVLRFNTKKEIPKLEVNIFDIFGKSIVNKLIEDMGQGLNVYRFSTQSFSTGTYFCRLSSSDFIQSTMFRILK